MATTLEWINRVPRLPLSRSLTKADIRIAPALASVAWILQAGVIAFLAVYLLGNAASGLVDVIGAGFVGAAAFWQVALSVVALAAPFVAAAGVGVLVRRDGGSLALTAASTAAMVLCMGLTEMGLTGLFILFAGS